MPRKRQTRRWLRQHQRDPFVRRAQSERYRSRAAFKLLQIDQGERILRTGAVVLELGAAPGGWSQVAARAAGPKGRVVGVDLLPMAPLPGVEFVEGDIADPATVARILAVLGERLVDLVLSDMAPNITGIRDVDEARWSALAENALELATQVLAPNADLLIKVFEGEASDRIATELGTRFARLNRHKPEASRAGSRETYILARGYRGAPVRDE